ncbi:AraC family transcriptional regulator [Flavobacteriaceae bacterium]|nr:AraC family transcriptional regulator [Flavobacteriaceae bacterium]MDA8630477.1 AraC family transcriptional regulator [Flavobacteriaceae bacterium]MDA8703956.1 AraC family transcriptional regulator [Flavobacteriaceae bacterium]MDA8934821.1 AraC family transcriptional regulator [Flavobacteriaceae bacterium]MDA9083986.1 AraC family transcriptional regulator [Flavobacteriaceae bacterium]|tara:strand:+ start:22 stop:873 length:852 start_codon:yes stop_codon:yes gene_type:complete
MNTFKIDNEILINTYSNFEKDSEDILFSTDINFIQFHFCLEGKISFRYNNGSYTLDLKENNSLILFNPSTNLPIDATLQKNTRYLSLLITIKKFHGLFSELTDDISFLSQENSDKKYYKENIISPQISIILNQIINEKLSENVKNLYLKGKIFELLGIYFNESNDLNIEQCPFLADEKNVVKIKMAKEIIIKNFENPPSLKELSTEVEIPLKNLKTGFKQIYGNTVFGFLTDYKMNTASKMLSSRSFNVNEVSTHLGYSSSSHFINVFKKKFGITPKKYLSSN